MRKCLLLSALVALGACQQNVAVPTAQQLIDNPQLLTEWQAKCNTGEYSHVSADQKIVFCTTTQNATFSNSEIKQGKEAEDFYDANTLRKK